MTRRQNSSALIALLGLFGCGGDAPRSEVQVTSFSPNGTIDSAETITIRFDKPVIDDAKIAQPIDPSAIRVEPAFPWKGYWHDKHTMVIDPTSRLTSST